MSERKWVGLTKRDDERGDYCFYLGDKKLFDACQECKIFDIQVGSENLCFDACVVWIETEEKENYGPEGPTGGTYESEIAYAKTQDGIIIRLTAKNTKLSQNVTAYKTLQARMKAIQEQSGNLSRELREIRERLGEG